MEAVQLGRLPRKGQVGGLDEAVKYGSETTLVETSKDIIESHGGREKVKAVKQIA